VGVAFLTAGIILVLDAEAMQIVSELLAYATLTVHVFSVLQTQNVEAQNLIVQLIMFALNV
jgi:hypothetical protein